MLEIRGVSKTFLNTTVLTEAHVEVHAGEVHALVGENGSGKSTLVKILAGYHLPDDGGVVLVRGEELSFDDAKSAERLGLRFVHQDLGLVADLNSIDNLALGVGYRVGFAGRIHWRDERVAARKVLASLGYEIDVNAPVSSLSISERTAIAIARALSDRRSQLNVLVLDEPTANLPAAEVERLFALLRRIRDNGVAIVFISHHFNEVFNLADRVTVLRDGRTIGTRRVADITEEDLIQLMIGHRLEVVETARAQDAGERDNALRVTGLSGTVVHDLDLTVARGEIVGIAGITGSGREEVARLLGGDKPREGRVEVAGFELPPERPDVAVKHKMAYVPAERGMNAVIFGHSIRENLTISRVRDFVRTGRISRRLERLDVGATMDEFDIRPRKPELDITMLSGGNQQKVMLARAMRLNPAVLILDDPTQGVDIGAQSELYRAIRGEAERGVAVLVCSSVSEELAQLVDRVLVLSEGKIVAEFVAPIDPDQITAASLTTTQKVSS
ncbi:ribose ABC transporter ATP-binding protein RbsA [soil metagenome]